MTKLDICKEPPTGYSKEHIYIKESKIFFNYIDFNLKSMSNNKIYATETYILDIENNTIKFNSDDSIEEIIFKNCEFNCDIKFTTNIVNTSVSIVSSTINNKLILNNCKIEKFRIENTIINILFDLSESIFLKDISFNHVIFEKEIQFSNNDNKVRFNKNLSFSFCTFNDIFYFQNIKIKENFSLGFFRSIFNAKCLMQYNNFEKNRVSFQQVEFNKTVYFNDTIFSSVNFKNTMFEKNAIFIDTQFKATLDLRETMLNSEANFIGTVIKNIANYETARIIKYQFEKISNKIEANKYHALELKIKKEKEEFGLTYIPLFFQWMSSNYSRNWFLTLCWIILVGLLTNDMLHYNLEIEGIVKYMSIFTYDNCIKSSPFIFLFNKVTLGYLYYQFLTSVRKDTRK